MGEVATPSARQMGDERKRDCDHVCMRSESQSPRGRGCRPVPLPFVVRSCGPPTSPPSNPSTCQRRDLFATVSQEHLGFHAIVSPYGTRGRNSVGSLECIAPGPVVRVLSLDSPCTHRNRER
eukprot:scaffold1063_cov318-Pavlova_lutheri.AAC.15